MTPISFETAGVHAGREDFRALGVHAAPLDFSTTYPIGELSAAIRDIDELISGGRPETNEIYSRLANRTVDRFERAFAQLEHADDSVAFGSGMAAVTAALLVARQRGSHVVAVRPLYGGTDHLLASRLLALDVTWATAGGVGTAIRPETALVVIETPANPTLALVDIADMVRQAGAVPVLVDSTFATPVLQCPLDLGATLSLHSGTKYLGGHGDVMAGVIAANDDWSRALRQVRILTGGVLHPMGAYMLHRGLQTLAVRVRTAQAGAVTIAERLLASPAVEHVYFPGLPGGDPHKLIGRQMSGPGAMISFDIVGGFDAAATVLREVRLLTPAVSLGSTDSLIQHPAGLTHRVIGEAARHEEGLSPGMLRLSIGLESPDDLWVDLNRALSVATAQPSERAMPAAG
ncbi:MAG: trans-sulfuration enzyme family protein [Gemmatimonadaceae bacterium]